MTRGGWSHHLPLSPQRGRWLGWAGIVAVGVGGLLMSGAVVESGEHGGQEHGGWTSPSPTSTSQPSKPVPDRKTPSSNPTPASTLATPTKPSTAPKKSTERAADELAVPAESIRQHIESYVTQQLATDGTYVMDDQETGATRRLEFVRVHERVGMTGAFYYSCADLRDVTTGELLDLDFDVMATGDQLEVVDARIHKVDGKARYTYDSDDNRISIPPSQR